MSSKEERAFGLDYCLHTSLFQVEANCTGGERLVDDVPKCFGDLDCIFSLLRSDQVDSMMNVDRREFQWVTSSGLL